MGIPALSRLLEGTLAAEEQDLSFQPAHPRGRTWRLPLAGAADGWGSAYGGGVGGRAGREECPQRLTPQARQSRAPGGAGKPGRGREAGGGAGRVASRPRPRPAPSFLRGAPWPSPHLKGQVCSPRISEAGPRVSGEP